MNVELVTPKFVFFERKVYQATYKIDGEEYDIRTSKEVDSYGKHLYFYVRGGEYNLWTSDIQIYDTKLKEVVQKLSEQLIEDEE
jgi:hypothetical protein